MNFQNFSGNEFLKNSFELIENHNRMPHAVIINGGSQENRRAVALHLAQWAVCSGEEKPCHNCKDCLNAESKSHSDIYFAKGEGKTNIYNKEELKKIVKDSYVKPNQADKKVYIFEECDRRFPVISQNAFLKTLEEPPQDVLFIMTCENSNTLLGTILSRATVFSLDTETKIPEETLLLAKEIALALINPEEIQLLKSLNKLSKREAFIDVMGAVVLILRDGLAFSLNNEPVVDRETAQELSRRLTKLHYIKLIEISNNAINKVSQNVSLKLLATWLCGEYRRILWQR